MAGEIVVLAGDYETSVGGAGDWPGRAAGLSPREAEVIALITQGLSNQEIADRAYLSINSVKTYIRSAYRKIGVTRRTQAVLWGVDNGFKPDTLRTIDPALLVRSGQQHFLITVARGILVSAGTRAVLLRDGPVVRVSDWTSERRGLRQATDLGKGRSASRRATSLAALPNRAKRAGGPDIWDG